VIAMYGVLIHRDYRTPGKSVKHGTRPFTAAPLNPGLRRASATARPSDLFGSNPKAVDGATLARPRHRLQVPARTPGIKAFSKLPGLGRRPERPRDPLRQENLAVRRREGADVGPHQHEGEPQSQRPVRAFVNGRKHRVELCETFGRPLLEFGSTFEANAFYARS